MKSYRNYWQHTQPKQPTNPPIFQQYHYDAKFRVEIGKLLGKLHLLFERILPEDCINQIEYKPIKHSLGGNHYLQGYQVIFSNNTARRYLMDKDGKWFEAPNLMNWWVGLGYEVNDDTLEAFAVDIQTEYYTKGLIK
ncbi:hypothetical protein [Fictibacillus gelatini]|uniref:hypothetical protein n=1 Tax=Fictibacillus gelatini TaxID=225985 RepID=UPI00047946B0|nr:hypothetical protein [Fictibacillus gelatini]